MGDPLYLPNQKMQPTAKSEAADIIVIHLKNLEMLKSISNWLSKKPQTKASYISAIASLVLVSITAVAVYVAIRESNLNRKIAAHSEAEKIVLQFQGGEACRDFETSFRKIDSMSGNKKTVFTSMWPIIISNNGQNTVSLVDYSATSHIHGKVRNIQTRLYDADQAATSMPVVVDSGASMKLFLVVPIHIPDSVYKLVENVLQFSSKFTPRELTHYLQEQHEVDFYGNKFRYAVKYKGVGKDRVAVHIFGYNEDGMLHDTSMQADQVTLEFKSARGNYFTTKALYFDTTAFRPPKTIYLPQGRPAKLNIKLDALDALPTNEDANTK